MESLVVKPKKLAIEYDEKSNVLYIPVGKPKEEDEPVESQASLGTHRRAVVPAEAAMNPMCIP